MTSEVLDADSPTPISGDPRNPRRDASLRQTTACGGEDCAIDRVATEEAVLELFGHVRQRRLSDPVHCAAQAVDRRHRLGRRVERLEQNPPQLGGIDRDRREALEIGKLLLCERFYALKITDGVQRLELISER